MKLIVGLGNPGEKYKETRHNAGFMFVEYFARHSGPSRILRGSWSRGVYTERSRSAPQDDGDLFKNDKYSNSEIAEINQNDTKIVLAKPQTFMNRSGEAVKALVKRYEKGVDSVNYQLQITNDLYLAHDDLDLPFGHFKIQQGKGPELHYGVNSVEQHLKTKDFWRVRIGIDGRTDENRISGETYTLQNFTSTEKQLLEELFAQIVLELFAP